MASDAAFGSRSPVFVVAYAHSGTTMMRQVLCAAPEVFDCKNETRFFANLDAVQAVFNPISNRSVRRELVHYVARILDTYGSPRIVPASDRCLDDDVANEIAAADNDHIGVFVDTVNYITERAGKMRWLEKTPAHIYSANLIKDTVPTACFAEIVRSPFDALASKKKRQEVAAANKGIAGRPQVDRFFHPLWDAISWRAAVRAGDAMRAAHPDSIVRVRYEDVVNAPEEALSALCSRVGVSFVPEMLNIRRANATGGGPKDRGISRLSVERWKDVLTPGEIAIISMIVGRTARSVGYELPKGRFDASAARWVGRTISDPFERTFAHARRTGWRSALSAVGRYRRRLLSSKK